MSDENKSELDAVRARREEIRKARDERDAQDTLALEKLLLEREEILFALEGKHGPLGKGICVVEVPDGRFIVARKPHAATYNKFQDVKEAETKDFRAFVTAPGQLLHPDNATSILDDYPALVAELAVALTRLCGAKPKI